MNLNNAFCSFSNLYFLFLGLFSFTSVMGTFFLFFVFVFFKGCKEE